jgi:adenylate cyclase
MMGRLLVGSIHDVGVAAELSIVAVVVMGVHSVEGPVPPRLSIAVLPFANATGEARNDDLVATLTEDTTTGLREVSGSSVVARSVTQASLARKLTLSETGKELGVRYVLEGNLRWSSKGGELRVQLNDTVSGASVWASQFEGSASEPADLSTEIIQNLIFSLATAFMDAEARRLSAVPADGLIARDLLLQVRASVRHQPLAPAKDAGNVATLERALALEPMSAEIMIELKGLRSRHYASKFRHWQAAHRRKETPSAAQS